MIYLNTSNTELQSNRKKIKKAHIISGLFLLIDFFLKFDIIIIKISDLKMDKNKKRILNIQSALSFIKYNEVETSNGVWKVRGLNTDEITYLYLQSPEVLNYLLEDVQFKELSAEKLALKIANKLPTLGYLLLAMATDSDIEEAHLFGKIGLSDNLLLLKEVIDLTTPSDLDEAKKILATMNSIFLKQIVK